MNDLGLWVLEESRRREKDQTLFYRELAGIAELRGDSRTAERLNALHADEQHHLSRLSARILEMGGFPAVLAGLVETLPDLEGWEAVARARELQEVAWYESVLEKDLDGSTRDLLEEILDSERHHARELGGKWMSA